MRERRPWGAAYVSYLHSIIFFNRNITLFLRRRVTNSLPRTKIIPSVSATCMLSFRGERNASEKYSFQLYRNSDYLTTRPFQTASTHERSLQCYYCIYPFSSPSIFPLRSTSTTPPLRTALATVLDCWWLPFSRYISPSRAARSRSTPITSWLPPQLVSFPGGERDTGGHTFLPMGHTDATQNKRRTKAGEGKGAREERPPKGAERAGKRTESVDCRDKHRGEHIGEPPIIWSLFYGQSQGAALFLTWAEPIREDKIKFSTTQLLNGRIWNISFSIFLW